MNKLLIGTVALTIGAYSGIFSAIGLVSQLPLQVADNRLTWLSEQQIDIAFEGQTKIFPDVQLQPASSVQSTIGVE